MKTLCVDFDGVLHSYTSGWKGIDKIPDPPVPGALQFLLDATKQFDEVVIFSSRSENHKGVFAMQHWLIQHYIRGGDEFSRNFDGVPVHKFVQGVLGWPVTKPAAFVTLDDRCVCFDGKFPAMDALLNFRPWNKPPVITQPPVSEEPGMIRVGDELRTDDEAAP